MTFSWGCKGYSNLKKTKTYGTLHEADYYELPNRMFWVREKKWEDATILLYPEP